MSEIILHHYPTSPYGEIVRLALGAKGLAWRSVEQSNIMPRPHLSPLTGGYRRIPVMQVGADIYCDTGLILSEIDRRFPDPPLAPKGVAGAAWALRNWAERAWFQSTVAVVFGARGDAVPEAFIKDREQLSGRPFDVAALKAAAPVMAGQWRANAALIDQQAGANGPFLFGETPTAADLAAYLNIWFLRSGNREDYERLTQGLPALVAWAGRMAAIGHGTHSPMTPEDALAVATATDPEAARASDSGDAQGLAPGMTVSVMPDDYGRMPTTGVISLVTATEIALRRHAEGAGEVATHFPRAGFVVMPG